MRRMINGRNILLKVHGSAVNILLTAVVCTVFASCGGGADNCEDPSVIFAEAGEAYGRGDLTTCRELLLRVTVLDPENPNVWRNLGTVNLDLGLYDDAISAYWMVIEIDSTRVDVLTDVTGALVGAGRIEEALHTGEMSVQFSPEDGLAFNNYGMALMESGNYEEAAVCFSTALHREPENSFVLYNCGRITLLSGDMEGALSLFQMAVEADPGFLQPRIEAARTLGMLGRHEDAEEQILSVLAVSPSDPEALNILALSYSSQGRLEEAVSVLESILENNPDDPVSRLGLAQCFYQQGDMQNALQNYRVFMASLEDTVGTSEISARILELEEICD